MANAKRSIVRRSLMKNFPQGSFQDSRRGFAKKDADRDGTKNMVTFPLTI